MTLTRVEGFDWMPTAAQDAGLAGAKGWYPYNGQSFLYDVGRFGFGKAMIGGGYYGTDSASNFIPILGTYSEGYIGFAHYVPAGISSDPNAYSVAAFMDGTFPGPSAAQFSVCFHFNGIVEIWRGHPNNGVKLATSYIGQYQTDRWMYVEIHGLIDAVAGSVEVRINTVTVLSLVSANTKFLTSGVYNMIGLGSCYISGGLRNSGYQWDDFYHCNTAGTVNNAWLGNVRVRTQFASGAGANTGLTIGGTAPAATNWQSVLNTALDDTKYVYSPTVGLYDLYTVQAIVNAPKVFGVQVAGAYRQDDATQRVAHNLLRSGTTNYEGTDKFLNQNYTFYADMWELNPATGIAWTGTEVNGIQIGTKVQA